jgi:hypothetical protein
VPCVVVDDGRDGDGYPKFRIVAEIDWQTYHIVRVEIKHWPYGSALSIALPDWTPEQAMAYASRIEWIDLTGRDN